MSVASTLLLLSVYSYIYAREREACFLLWAGAVVAAMLRYPATFWLLAHGPSPIGLIAADLPGVCAGVLAVAATRSFVGNPHRKGWRALCLASVFAATWVVHAAFGGVRSPYLHIPTSWLAAVALTWCGWMMLASPRLPRPANRYVGWAFVLIGVQNLAYPFLQDGGTANAVAHTLMAVSRGFLAVSTLVACLETVTRRLAERDRVYQLLAETASDVIMLIDSQGMLIYTNPAGQRLLELQGPGPIGRSLAEFVPPGQREQIESLRHECLSGAAATHFHEVCLSTPGGAVVTLEASCSQIPRPGGDPVVLVVARDTSERQREQRFLETLMGNLPGMVYRCNDDEGRTLTYVSAGAQELAGVSPESLHRDGGVTHASLVHPADRWSVEAEVRAAVSEGRTFEIEYRLIDAGGGAKHVRERGRAVDLGDGQRTIEGFVSDISESRRLSEQLRQAQKMEEIGRLAGGIAHDFNNLLTAVTGYGHFLKEALPEAHAAQRDIAGLLAATDKAAHLTRQLLAFSRRQAVEKRPINLNELVTNMSQLLRRLIGEDIEISVITDDGLRLIEGDPGQLEQALVNLVVNARDAMPNGGRLVVETTQYAFTAEDAASNPAITAGNYAALCVSDSGIGMTQEVKDHLFEPFFTTKEVGRGTGLGLAMVYATVQQHHGDIRVYSEPYAGTSVKLFLPCMRGGDNGRGQAPVLAELPRGRETVLVAEDEASVRTLVLRMLDGLGYRVLEAGDGSEALRLAEEHDSTIDLLLTDLVMPLMGGRQLDAALRQSRPGLRTLYMSGYTDSAVLNRGLLGPDAAFLQKPFTARALAIAVRRTLDPSPPPVPMNPASDTRARAEVEAGS